MASYTPDFWGRGPNVEQMLAHAKLAWELLEDRKRRWANRKHNLIWKDQ